MADIPQRLYRTKLTLLAVLFVVAGVALEAVARGVRRGWLIDLPIGDVGSGLFTTGLIGVALQYLDARDADQRASERLRKVIAEEAPAIRDAVVDGSTKNIETVSFSVDGASYEIDLGPKNAKAIRTDFAKWAESARKAKRGATRTRRGTGAAKPTSEAAAIRAWATEQGIEVPSRGRIPAAVAEQYHAAP